MNVKPMISTTINIDFKIGIHSRPAALIVKKVKEYSNCKVTLSHNGKTCRADSLIGLLQLGITTGAEIALSVDGKNEEAVLKDMVSFINNEVAQEG